MPSNTFSPNRFALVVPLSMLRALVYPFNGLRMGLGRSAIAAIHGPSGSSRGEKLPATPCEDADTLE